MQIVILAGGLGTRVKEISKGRPKSLISIHGKPFLDYQLSNLQRQGFSNFHLCLGVGAKEILSFLDEDWINRVQITHSFDAVEGEGTANALVRAAEFLEDDFAIVYGDSFLDENLKLFLQTWRETNELSLMTLKALPWELGQNNVAKNGRLVTRYEKGLITPTLTHVDFGFQIFRKAILDTVTKLEISDLGDLNRDLIERQMLAGHEVEGMFYEIGSYAGIENFTSFIRGDNEVH